MKLFLEKAIQLAVFHHKGQVDKGGNPYILHPLAVMMKVHKLEEKIVAVLHDIIEDTPLTLDDLRNEGFPEFIVEAVDSITKRKKESYDSYIYRVKLNPISRVVKLADISENLDLSRIPNPTEKDYLRIDKYKHIQQILTVDSWIYENKKWINKAA
ncbi:GTP pyrophosphokinase [Bacillus cereus]|uniref:GTP pyrophosphokinase n=1 Tax=Bacillus cereus TaxID=1396 RepID=A0A9X6XVI1_BACCE|nr:bifunctional (p)ppGpp synthetase/guanosine-3',5'-bis(diphosphate) 3'-pyrophosphohydrolase [Bacillus cereus]PDZ94326.1 GTP pyrophosphokinase [Bacillus cereus]